MDAHSYSNLGISFHAANRYMEAEEAYRKALELAPQKTNVRSLLSLTLLAQGRNQEALAEAIAEPDEGFRLWAMAIVHHVLGSRAQSNDILRELIGKYADVCACQIAEVYGVRGQADAAFEWLERAYAQRDPGLTEMMLNPNLRSLHDDPR